MHRCYLKPRWFLNEDESEKSALRYHTRAQCNRSPPPALPLPLAGAAGPCPFPSGAVPSPPLPAAFRALSCSCTRTRSRAAALRPELLPAQEAALSCFFLSLHSLSHITPSSAMIFFLNYYYLFIHTTNDEHCQAEKLGHVVLQWLLQLNSTPLFLVPMQENIKLGRFWMAGTGQWMWRGNNMGWVGTAHAPVINIFVWIDQTIQICHWENPLADALRLCVLNLVLFTVEGLH